jgi:hypothetical protein
LQEANLAAHSSGNRSHPGSRCMKDFAAKLIPGHLR